MFRQEDNWQPRPRKLSEFTADAQVRLRQLDFNRTITIYIEKKVLNVRRTGLDQFQCVRPRTPPLMDRPRKPLESDGR